METPTSKFSYFVAYWAAHLRLNKLSYARVAAMISMQTNNFETFFQHFWYTFETFFQHFWYTFETLLKLWWNICYTLVKIW